MSEFGVIVGRFQVPDLHLGHNTLFNQVLSRHSSVVVFIGTTQAAPNNKNPLNFAARKRMVNAQFPQVSVESLPDVPGNDQKWSQNLDQALTNYVGTPILYGSRDSFIKAYKGIHKTVEIPVVWERSGSEIRKELMEPIQNANFRAGIIHNIMTRYPIVYPTVDIAVIRNGYEVGLGRKPGMSEWVFPGGFVDPTDLSMEAAARRELREEFGSIEVADWSCIGTNKMNDPRYMGTKDGIMTTFFKCTYMYGAIQGADDLEEAKFFSVHDLPPIYPVHQPLVKMLEQNLMGAK